MYLSSFWAVWLLSLNKEHLAVMPFFFISVSSTLCSTAASFDPYVLSISFFPADHKAFLDFRYPLMKLQLQSVSWILEEFYFNRGLQRLYTGTCIILQKTINGFLCLLIVFLKRKTYQLILKDVIKLNRNLR